MVIPGTTVVLPSPDRGLRSQVHGTTKGRILGEQTSFKENVTQAAGKVKKSKRGHDVFTHGLHLRQHFSCDSPVRFMMYSEAAAAFISLHSDNSVCFYTQDGHKQTASARLTFTGLIETKISDRLVGWGPGPVFTLLDNKLRPLEAARDALDIRVCEAAEHSAELVTAGAGNVCVWSVMLMRYKLKVEEGLQHRKFTHMVLAPPRFEKPHRAYVVCGRVVTVVDLDGGKVLEHKTDLCSGDITAMAFCARLDCLITASQELSIQVWGPDWEQRVAFEGGVVNSLFFCPAVNLLLSAANDCSIRCWNVEDGDAVQCVHTEQENPPVCIGGTRKGDTFFSFSHRDVDFWFIRNLYTLHCTLERGEKAPLRQILVTSFPAPFPTRVLCVSGDRDISLVAAETGALLTSFRAEQRVLCADYCLQKEILLALTETGTVLQANMLTNPVSLMQEWKGRGQGPWQCKDHVTEKDAQNLPIPGPACCLVLYCYVAETQDALEEWRSLQDSRGCSRRNKKALHDAKNTFLIILGQSGGCVSVLKFSDGKVMCRMPAHNGQRVTAMHVYPEHGYLLSTGEDLTLVVWRVNPFVQECLSQKISLHCGQPQVYLAALGPRLALTFQDPSSDTYKLVHLNLLNQSQADDPPTEGHLDHITGLCACPDLDVFVSSSLDRTVCIWNEENQLVSTLQLNAEPGCLAYSGFGGELFLGIRGDLYKMDCAKYLPHIYQQMLLYTFCAKRVSDFPVIENREPCSKRKIPSVDGEEDQELQAISRNVFLSQDVWRQTECEGLTTFNTDLSALIEGSVKCRKGKPPSTKETKREAFDHYMKILYGLPLHLKIDLGDTFEPKKCSFNPEPHDYKPYKPPVVKEAVCADSKGDVPDVVKTQKKAPETKSKPKTLMIVEQWPAPKVTPKKAVKVEKREEATNPPEIIPQKAPPKPKTPTPRPRKQKPPPAPTPPLPPRAPTPEVPTFLKQFTAADWFKDLFPDKKCIPSTLSPEDFSLQLLGSLNTCSPQSKVKILAALRALHNQRRLHNAGELSQGLVDLLPTFVKPHMSAVERTALVELFHLLMHLKSVDSDLVIKLLTLLAFKKLGLRDTVLGMLTAAGVHEAEKWLWPELESWDSELRDPSNIWKHLHHRADGWLELWISKYKEHDKWKPPTFSVVDVLNYFCSVQKEEYRKARCVAPAHKNTVLLPLTDSRSQPILRLGETYSMARMWRPPGITLPPLRTRPFLSHFPSFICLPLTWVTLRPFHVHSEDDWVKASTRRYFIHQQSYVEYYR